MPDNPYTREISVSITEIVPDRRELPQCQGWVGDYTQCGNRARYLQDDPLGRARPLCGVHVARPGLLFYPPERSR
jgi:hypothetical protein